MLCLSSLFPNATQPTKGIFLEHRLKHLALQPNISLRVVAPVPWFPSGSRHFGRFAAFARSPKVSKASGLDVSHPRYFTIPKIGSLLAPWFIALSILKSLLDMRKTGFTFDVIDAYYLYPDGVAAAILGRLLGVPVVLTAFGSDVSLIPRDVGPRLQIMQAMKYARGLTAVCDALRREMEKLGATPGKIEVVEHGVDLDLFAPPVDRAALRKALGMATRTLLSVGWLIERKGHGIAISALRFMPDARLLIAGVGPLEGALRAQARSEGVADRVEFLGEVTQPRLAALMGATDALVLCSDREGIANVLLEAMACGTPVIATAIWGTPEVVDDRVTGVLLDERTPKALAEGAARLFARPVDRAAIRAHAEQFSWHRTGQTHAAVLRRAVRTAVSPAQVHFSQRVA